MQILLSLKLSGGSNGRICSIVNYADHASLG